MKEKPSLFTHYELDAEELRIASSYPHVTYLWFRDLQATAAEQKLALKFDPSNPQAFIQEEAYLSGQLELLTFLLDARDSAALESQQPQQQDSLF